MEAELFHSKMKVTLAAATCGLLLSASGGVRAEGVAAPPAHEVRPAYSRVWTEPSEAVRAAAGAFRNACAGWQQRVEAVPQSDPASPFVPEPVEAEACDAMLDPHSQHLVYMGYGALAASGLLGAAAGTCATVAMLLRLLTFRFGLMLDAMRDRWSPSRGNWRR